MIEFLSYRYPEDLGAFLLFFNALGQGSAHNMNQIAATYITSEINRGNP